MNVAAVQFTIKDDPAENIDAVNELTANIDPSVVLLPELFTTGFNYDFIEYELPENHHAILADLSGKHTFLGSIVRKTEHGFKNSFFIHRDGTSEFIYDKMHLFPPMMETDHFSRGERPAVFDLDGTTAGAMICFDLRFPELSRHYFRNGAQIIFVPSEWPAARRQHLRALCLARAIENQAFLVMTNATGTIRDTKFGGGSMIIDPAGGIIAEALDDETVLMADINPDEATRLRADFPIAPLPPRFYE